MVLILLFHRIDEDQNADTFVYRCRFTLYADLGVIYVHLRNGSIYHLNNLVRTTDRTIVFNGIITSSTRVLIFVSSPCDRRIEPLIVRTLYARTVQDRNSEVSEII